MNRRQQRIVSIMAAASILAAILALFLIVNAGANA